MSSMPPQAREGVSPLPQSGSSPLRDPALLWKRLLTFYTACVEHQDASRELLSRSASGQQYVFPPLQSEEIVSGTGTALRLDPRSLELAKAALQQKKSLYYGYPVVMVHKSDRGTGPGDRRIVSRRLAPLFAVELALPASQERLGGSLEVRGDAPVLHAGALAAFGLGDEQAARLMEALPIEPHSKSHPAIQGYLHDLASQIPLPVNGPLDPAHLLNVKEDEIDREGLHNVAMLFLAEGSQYNDRLLAELRELKRRWPEARKTAAGFLVQGIPPPGDGGAPAPWPVTAPLPINEAQREALESALSRPLTVVTGPPGTGKSQLVTNVIASAWMAGQTVLVASNNNQAVDVVCERAQQIWKGLVVRTGTRDRREQAKEDLQELLQRRGATPDLAALKAGLESSRHRLQTVGDQIERRTQAETRLAEVILTREHFARRLGIDLAAPPPRLRTDRGVQQCLRRGERIQNARFLRNWRLSRFLRALGLSSPHQLAEAVEFLRAEAEWRDLRGREKSFRPIDALLKEKLEAEKGFRSASEAALRCEGTHAFRAGRDRILQLTQARSLGKERNPAAEAFPGALPHVRAWAATCLSIGASAPLQAGLFDLVIIDEASQCPIPAILPLLFRARRALIIGDPNQLAHITTISAAQERARLILNRLDPDDVERRGLSFRKHSVYQALEPAAPKIHVLDEHYRCHPHIVEVSNKLFYGGRLTVLTDPSRLFRFGTNACAWKHVPGEAERPRQGSARNYQEALAVIEEVRRIGADEGFQGSLGVVTLFSAQTRLLEKLAEERLSPEIRRRLDLGIGTAHTFQGGERDVILFSPVASQGLPQSSLRWLLATPNLFNVAITRARSYLLVVGNREFCEALQPGSNQPNVLLELARHTRRLEVEQDLQAAASRGDLHSEPEVRLYRALLEAGVPVTAKPLVHGYECDFALDIDGMLINIECDGRHHQDKLGRLRQQDRVRDQLLEQAGWKVVRIPAWKCLSQPAAAAQEVLQVVQSRGAPPGEPNRREVHP